MPLEIGVAAKLLGGVSIRGGGICTSKVVSLKIQYDLTQFTLWGPLHYNRQAVKIFNAI